MVFKIANFEVVSCYGAFADIAKVKSWRSAYFFLLYLCHRDPYVVGLSTRLSNGDVTVVLLSYGRDLGCVSILEMLRSRVNGTCSLTCQRSNLELRGRP